MFIFNYISRKASRVLPFVAAALLWGCTDDIDAPDVPQYADDTQLVINLAIPHGEQVPLSNPLSRTTDNAAGPDIDEPTFGATVDELRINSLQLYVFPENAQGNLPAAVKLNMLTPSAEELINNGSKLLPYEVKGLEKNVDYRVYIIANYGETGRSFNTMSALENEIIEYAGEHELKAGNLPMVYKSPNTFRITDDNAGKPIEVNAAMQYACVKLRYSIIFDKDNPKTAENFESSFIRPSNIQLNNVAYKSRIGYFPDDFTSLLNYKKVVALSNRVYTGNSFTYTAANKDVNDKFMVNLADGAATALPSTIDASTRWALHGTIYLSERYVEKADDQTNISLNSAFNGGSMSSKHSMTVGEDGSDFRRLQRGFCYELVGHIVNPNTDGIVWECSVVEWQDVTISVDFVHTYLTLDKTEVYVDTEVNGEIKYDTDGRGGLGFDCEFKVNDKNVFELAPSTVANESRLIIRPSSQVAIKDIPADKRSGSTTCYIIAGNIKKAIKVNYSLEGFLEITPENIKIQDGDQSVDSDHVFSYRTNLGGFVLTSENLGTTWKIEINEDTKSGPKVHQFGDSKFTISFGPGSDASSGTITITDVTYAKTTEIHAFLVTPVDTESFPDDEEYPHITVDIMSSKDKYRIYFRAINDYQHSDDDIRWDVPEEYTGTAEVNNNWIDWWSTLEGTIARPESHMIYAYTQYGETANDMPVWRYTGDYGKNTEMEYKKVGNTAENVDETLYGNRNNHMIADYGNPGWYYYDIPVFCEGRFFDMGQTISQDKKDKYGNGPLPGATLLIFHNDGTSGTRHRLNQDKDPGVPLGDDNDNETWVLYDPSRDPIFNVYNDKPRIVNTTYTIYSDVEFGGWLHVYGSEKHHLSSNLTNASSTLTSAQISAGYNYKYTVIFKTPVGEYNKNISLMRTNVATPPQVAIGLYGDWNAGGTPFALFKSEDTSGTATKELFVEMTQIPNEAKEYFCVVPQEFWGKWVVFCNHAKNAGFENWKRYKVPNNGQLFMTYTDKTGSDNEWLDRGAKYQTTVVESANSVLMFGGANRTTGYYKNGVWRTTP